jgi:hypothetical protein
MAPHSFHFDNTYKAGGERFKPVIMAHGWYFDSIPPGQRKNCFAAISLNDGSIQYNIKGVGLHNFFIIQNSR